MDGELSQLFPTVAPDLGLAVTAAVAEIMPVEAPLATYLRQSLPPGATACALFDVAQSGRNDRDTALLKAARNLRLSPTDLIGLSLLAAVERNPAMPSAMRLIQGDGFGPWPSVATLGRVIAHLGQGSDAALPDLSRLIGLGMVLRIGERMPAGEERLALSPPILAALGLPSVQPGIVQLCPPQDAPVAWREAARRVAGLFDRAVCIVLRQGDPGDKRLFAALIAAALDRTPVLLEAAQPGFGAAVTLGHWLPVEAIATSAGHRSDIQPITGYTGPRIILAHREGGVQAGALDCCDLGLPEFSATDRAAQWERLLPGTRAAALHAGTRIGPSRLSAVAARARIGPDRNALPRLRAAMGEEYRADMEPHAALIPAEVTGEDFVADEMVTADLAVLLARCRFRAEAADNPVPGVRALLSGPSGTGKTMAASWLSTELGLPLFKLDLSSVVSKYIGETEENLARILDRAETADMVLLMDEADSLFSSRTETRDSSDRFANNQTNFLLSRIESFEGIAILTSNGPERFDHAFARRLDQVIEVPMPAARERRRIWRRHLGLEHDLSGSDLNRLAGMVDLAGGHIRNIAHTARVLAAARPRPIGFGDIRRGVDLEYTKLGRTPPGGLAR